MCNDTARSCRKNRCDSMGNRCMWEWRMNNDNLPSIHKLPWLQVHILGHTGLCTLRQVYNCCVPRDSSDNHNRTHNKGFDSCNEDKPAICNTVNLMKAELDFPNNNFR